jgi:hypothetical protein
MVRGLRTVLVMLQLQVGEMCLGWMCGVLGAIQMAESEAPVV